MIENSQKPIPVLVSGALGRMGGEVVNTVLNSTDCELVAAIDINEENNGSNISELLKVKDCDVFVSNDFEGTLCSVSQNYRNENIKPVLVDFTHPDSVYENTRSAIAYGVSPVVGTTGLSPSQIQNLSVFAQKASVGCAIIPNFSVGIVSTILRKDRLIALSFLRMGKSFVTGWGENDKLMSLNALDTLLIAMNQVLYLFIPFF